MPFYQKLSPFVNFTYMDYIGNILSTQLLLSYWQEIHQNFTDYLPSCIVVHEGRDLRSCLSTKSYCPLSIFLIYSIYGKKSCQCNSSETTGEKVTKLSQITCLGVKLCMKVGICVHAFLPKVIALCQFYLHTV